MDRQNFTCLLIGESSLLARCAEALTGRGHRVVGTITDDASIAVGENVYPSFGEARLGLEEQPDFLFSIVNRVVLKPEEIAFPKLAAINFHDSPLPAYAGVNAPSWAIFHGETSHGVTWHLMRPEVDAGDILVQREFPIAEDETALSLSAKCFEQGLDGFQELIGKIEAGIFSGVPQDISRRKIFPRSKRLPRQGIIRWSESAAEICRFVRAGQLGPYANDFGLPKILLPNGGLVAVGHAAVESVMEGGAAGTIVARDAEALSIIAGDGRVVGISELSELDGRVFDLPESLIGSKLPSLSPAQEEAIENAGIYAAKGEEETLACFKNLPAPLRPRGLRPFKFQDCGEHVFEKAVESHVSAGEILAPILNLLLSDEKGRPALVGLYKKPLIGFMAVQPFISRSGNCKALAHSIDRQFAAPAVPVDLPARFPEARGAWMRIESIAVCLANDSEPEVANPGLLVCCAKGRLVLRFAASQIDRNDAAELAAFLFGEASAPRSTPLGSLQFVHRRISNQAANAPDAIAVESDMEVMTYGALESRSNSLAAKLRILGAGRESAFALLLPQGIHFPAAVVGVLKSGSAYIPLETSMPLHRLRSILRDAKPLGVITDQAHLHMARQLTEDVILADGQEGTVPFDGEVLIDPEDLAYLIYTSGSTGEPKASMIEHRALARFIDADISRNSIGPGDRILQLCSLGFDASVEEIFSALCSGATLVVRPATLLDSAQSFLDFCGQARLTIIGIYASMLGDLAVAMERSGGFPESVRLATTGGEMVNAADAQKWRDFFAKRSLVPPRLLNVYGLTETTVANFTADLSLPGEFADDVPIGTPLLGNKARIVDDHLADVPVGEVGELLLAGPQLARAYWNRPAITSQRFFIDPADGTRWFRTGDFVRSSPGGSLYFAGRVDRQVKVNGVRIELEEIERAMLAHPDVAHAAMVLHRTKNGREIFAGFFSPAHEGLGESIRRHLEQRLPEAMRPRRLIGIEVFPVNDRGKTDYAALATLLEESTEADGKLQSQAEDAVSKIWRDFFPWCDPSDADESFFNLGGDSLLAVSMLLRIEQITGAPIPVSSFFREPSRVGLRKLIGSERSDSAHEPVIPLKPEGTKPRIYIVHSFDGDVGGYSELIKSLGSNQPVYGVRSRAILGKGPPPQSMQQAARDVLDSIISFSGEAPGILLGYSWAGILAYEVAVQCRRKFNANPLVILIDTVAPLPYVRSFELLMHLLQVVPRWTMRVGPSGWVSSIKRRLFIKSKPLNSESDPFSSQAKKTVEHVLKLADAYRATQEPQIVIHLLRATAAWRGITPLDKDIQKLWKDYGWRRTSGGKIHIHRLSCDSHFDLLRASKAQVLAEIINGIIGKHIEV